MIRQVVSAFAIAFMVVLYFTDNFSFGSFILTIMLANLISGAFSYTAPKKVESPAKPIPSPEPELDDHDVIRVRRADLKSLRNILLRHHNSRGTDREYQSSSMATDTNATIATLNDVIVRKLQNGAKP